MNCFWDTSAVLALIFQEPHTARAQKAAAETTVAYAWWWLEVEAWSGVVRRGGNAGQKAACRKALTALAWTNFPRTKTDDLLQLNAKHGLRVADAGHLFCFMELSRVVDGLTLVSFDREMVKAAKREGLAVFK
jgi:predicted nucleic acid-binding protein